MNDYSEPGGYSGTMMLASGFNSVRGQGVRVPELDDFGVWHPNSMGKPKEDVLELGDGSSSLG